MKNKIINLLVLLILICLSIIIIEKDISNIDFSLLAVGNKILENGVFISENPSWIEDLEFENINWLLNVLFAKVYNTFNYNGIYVLYIVLTTIVGFTVYTILKKKSGSIYLSFLFTAVFLFVGKMIMNNRNKKYNIIVIYFTLLFY